ncbi:ewing's tumor-associated antigen 1 isoform X1 [Seriola lalandi dorsalis]|uniref:ewing's tumor-associated antigen 1 isoform X1 n=1 Tax=Seriola lalandi dorsalis TaxID=1841481 RepID=UPI000C6FB779|nr:ewing's tumor-associated antigen 1 isoform X1 [Seriola lalandi dorsalis]
MTHAADAAAAASPEFAELWRSAAKLCHNTTEDEKTGRQMPGTTTPPVHKDLQSPKHRGCSRYPGFSYGDSPGDAEASQDIFWDSTSPTQGNTGSGLRNSRVVEISDIVNRIAPKDVKPKGTESPLLQWIGDSAVPCTPEIPQRARKKSSRQSSVEDLMKLARQFDKNMQQDKEISEQLNTVNNNLNEHVNTAKTKLTETSFHSKVKGLKCPSSADRVEAELHALFDSSTQRVSGPLSQGSSASACSQEIKHKPVSSTVAEPRQSELKLAPGSGSAAHPAEEKGSGGFSANNCDDFDDDWENDDLLNDSFVLAMTQNPDQQQDANLNATSQSNTKTNTTNLTSVCKPTANTNSAHQPSTLNSKPSCSVLQELCPKPKTTNRSTFKLESNPHFQPKTAAKEVSKSSFTVTQPKSQMSDQKSVTTKTPTAPQPDNITNDQRWACAAAGSVKDISDSLWDDGDDDALLYQVCDSVERTSNSQPQQVSTSSSQGKQDIAVDRQRKTTAPLPVDRAWSMKAAASGNRQSPCAFVRSNSLPGTSCETVNYQGWNIPMKGASNKSRMSQSLPGSRVSLGTFSQCRDSSGTFQAENANVDMKPHTVTARAQQNSKSHHTAFKRNVSDSAVISSKVFVTSQMTGKCSAAEIERKKQEALARRRMRMQNTPKP